MTKQQRLKKRKTHLRPKAAWQTYHITDPTRLLLGRIGDVHLTDMPTIGEQLKQARESRRLSIQQVVQAIRIRAHYLEAIEADDFSAMPSAAQARGFFRSYADFLGLNADELIGQQRSESAPPAPAVEQVPAQEKLVESGPEAAGAPESPAPPEQAQSPAEPGNPEPEPAVEIETPEPDELETALLQEETKAPAISQLIFFEIGHEIRQRREMLSLTLDEIERHTRVRKHYLEKIEAGNYDELPSPVQARGMLSNYASFLDMDAEALLLRFADALQARRLERQPATPQKSTLPRRQIVLPVWLGRFISPDLLFGGGMILVLFFLTLWGAVRIFSGGGARATETQGPSISDVLLASPVATTTVLPEALPSSVNVADATSADDASIVNVTDTAPPAGLLSSDLEVTLSVFERTFLRVTVDGEVKQEGRVAPGAGLNFQGKERIEVLTGSGSAIQVFFNQRDLGTMGNFGEVVDLIYTARGIATPTATPLPTVTQTPRFQRTPTLTPTATATPKPTATK